MNEVRFLYVTTPTKEEAQSLARHLLEKKWIACANLIPQMESIYEWDGKIQTEVETLVILKTVSNCVERVILEVESLHSYQTPCVLELKIESGSSKYMTWLAEQMDPTSAKSN